MPEGDAVRRTARRLDAALAGGTLVRAELRVPRFATVDLRGMQVLGTHVVGKHMLTDWDFQSGRTIHIAMHNWELDNLAYVLRLAWRFWKATNRVGVFDDTWLRAFDLILDTLECEQKHNEV